MSKVIKYMGILFLIGYFITLLAAPPGGGEDGWREFYAWISVSDPAGNPVSGVQVRLLAEIYGSEGDGSDIVYGTTDSYGYAILSTIVYYEGYEEGHHMSAAVISGSYTVVSSSNTYSNVSYDIDPDFDVIFDLDKDSIDDGIETQIADKFKPVLHKHSHDYQQGLQNFDNLLINGKFTLKVYNDDGQLLYNQVVSGSEDALHKWSLWNWDTYGYGSISSGKCNLDLIDSQRYLGASVGQRPLYYHVYKDDYYYVQYWYYFGMDDKTEFLNGIDETWHESDWEHVSIRVYKQPTGNFIPLDVNFYLHDGGKTFPGYDCWWSSDNSLSYSGIQQVYNESHTHLHIWISANGHASYNRFQDVYRIKSLPSGKSYQDRIDYYPAGNDLYFEYDFIQKLGEISEDTYIKCPDSNYTLEYHRYPKGSGSLSWLAFIGRCGIHENPWVWWGGYAPKMPSMEGISHGWNIFQIGTPYFGNDNFPTNLILSWVVDDGNGD